MQKYLTPQEINNTLKIFSECIDSDAEFGKAIRKLLLNNENILENLSQKRLPTFAQTEKVLIKREQKNKKQTMELIDKIKEHNKKYPIDQKVYAEWQIECMVVKENYGLRVLSPMSEEDKQLLFEEESRKQLGKIDKALEKIFKENNFRIMTFSDEDKEPTFAELNKPKTQRYLFLALKSLNEYYKPIPSETELKKLCKKLMNTDFYSFKFKIYRLYQNK